MRTLYARITLLGIALAATTAGSARAEVAYAVSSDVLGTSRLYRIDNFDSAPTAVVIGNTGRVLSDIGINPYTGQAYGVTAPGELFGINLNNGALTLIGTSGINGLNSLEVAPNGTIYARAFNSSFLWTLSPANGAATVLLDTGFGGGSDVALMPNTNFLYATANTGNGLGTGLIRVDLGTNAVLVVGAFGGNNAMAGLDFDLSGNLFGFRGADVSGIAEVHRISSVTASPSLIGAINGAGQLGLFGAAIIAPEPASFGLLATALLLAIRRR